MEKLRFHCSIFMFSMQYCFIVYLASSNTNIATDESALVALKSSITMDPYNLLANWSTSSSICSWVGVACDARHGRVHRLNLSDMGLEGTIPPQLGNLSFLIDLDLCNNSFHGDIPKEIAGLPNLKFIYLNVNQLSGSIPLTIFNNSKLELISLSDNRLTGRIPSDMCHGLPKLQYLGLDHNEFFGPIPLGWHQCKELDYLSLGFNKFNGNIPRDIGNLTMLQHLFLHKNKLEGSIPKEIGDLDKLESISLFFNKLCGPIPLNIFNISTLKMLSLHCNSLSGTLPSNMGCGLPNLKELYLHTNKLGGKIPNSISNASKLTIIELEDNQFNGIIPNTLGNLRDLQRFNIAENNLTTSTSAPEFNILTSLTNCKHLEALYLSANPLRIKLAKSIGNLSNSLQKIWASSCCIDGKIPLEIGNLSKLISLSLAYNDLNGLIPSTVDGLQHLQYLDLAENALEGTIVDGLCEIRGLDKLDLTKNKLSGAIPTCLGNLTFLRQLYMGSNKLISEIPSSLWSLKDILELDISSNLLKGKIPLAIGNLRALTLLDLSSNQISGTLPPTITSLRTLQNLILAHNRLEGSIPESLGNLVSLQCLDFSQNSFSGMIPKSLESLADLKCINFSNNRLQGEIPQGGPFVNFTAQSFMHNKALCGKPQLQVPPCSKKLRERSNAKLILIKFILPIIVSTILVVLCAIFLLWRKRKNTGGSFKRSPSDFATVKKISYYEILQATNRFDECNLIGMGSIGSVFKGMLSNGVMAAFKVFNLELEAISRNFDAECKAMRNLRHRNLVKIISSCSNIDFKCLVMEFMPNGSLEKWLHSHSYHLNFLQRLNIIIDVAFALEYLHHGFTTPVVHCDLKPSNILLDEDMVGHVGDFGISKLLKEGQSNTYTKTMPTIGYIAPEYGSMGFVSRKGDVYSYGITLLEMFTSKKPTDDMFDSGLSLKDWVNESMPHAISQVMDCNLLQEEEHRNAKIITSISSIFGLALNCCTNLPEARMDMTDVVVSLNKIKTVYLRRSHL